MTETNSASVTGAFGRLPDLLVVTLCVLIAGLGYLLAVSPAPTPPVAGAAPSGMPKDQLTGLPTDFASLVQLGHQAMDSGNFAMSAELYRRALEIDSSSIDVRVDYGASLHGMGLPDRALEEFRNILKIEPSHAVLNFNLGVVYLGMGVRDSATVYFERVVELAPSSEIVEQAKLQIRGIKAR